MGDCRELNPSSSEGEFLTFAINPHTTPDLNGELNYSYRAPENFHLTMNIIATLSPENIVNIGAHLSNNVVFRRGENGKFEKAIIPDGCYRTQENIVEALNQCGCDPDPIDLSYDPARGHCVLEKGIDPVTTIISFKGTDITNLFELDSEWQIDYEHTQLETNLLGYDLLVPVAQKKRGNWVHMFNDIPVKFGFSTKDITCRLRHMPDDTLTAFVRLPFNEPAPYMGNVLGTTGIVFLHCSATNNASSRGIIVVCRSTNSGDLVSPNQNQITNTLSRELPAHISFSFTDQGRNPVHFASVFTQITLQVQIACTPRIDLVF
jgi:hypothetical protein